MSFVDDDMPSDAELEARARSRLGETLRDKYRLDRVLGYGGMASVYAATHRNGKEVALKLLHPELANHPEVRKRFLREGYVANQVKHPGAVSVLDDDVTEDGGAFLVMELLSGVTLQELWEAREYRVHPAWVTAITLQLLDVMAAAHAHGIIHRDLKPANLFLTHDGELKVLDFGIARMRALHSPGARTTNLNAVLGTPAYMAPEQAMGRASEVDETTDLWAVAAVAFALLVGDVVHPAESSRATLVYAATRPARALGPLAPDAPPAIVRVLDRALAFDRGARWPSALAMREALVAAALEAFSKVPDAAVLREALGGARQSAEFISHADTVNLIGLEAASAPSSATPPSGPGHRATLRGIEVPFRPFLTGVAMTASQLVSAGAGLAHPGLRRRPTRGGVLALSAVAAVALAALTLPRMHAADRTSEVASAHVSGSRPTYVSSLALLTTATAEAAVAEESPSTPLPAVEATATPPALPARTQSGGRATGSDVHGPRRTVAAGTAAGSGASCTPPFVIDRATGRKKWKLECL